MEDSLQGLMQNDLLFLKILKEEFKLKKVNKFKNFLYIIFNYYFFKIIRIIKSNSEMKC